jgi:hypothetical protein
MPTNAELTAQLADMTKRATDAEVRVETLAADLADANDRADAEKSARQESEAAHDVTKEELRATSASLKAFKGSATKARGQAEILRKQLSPESRPIGAMKPPRNDDQKAARAEALEAAFAADTTELVFSDGRREIRELAPLVITGDAWRQTPQGRVLASEIPLEPGDCQRDNFELAGFALLNEAGDQVGYCALPDPIVIGRNQTWSLPLNTVRF